jgi:hypothetical protein
LDDPGNRSNPLPSETSEYPGTPPPSDFQSIALNLFQTPMSGPLARNTNCKEATLASG